MATLGTSQSVLETREGQAANTVVPSVNTATISRSKYQPNVTGGALLQMLKLPGVFS